LKMVIADEQLNDDGTIKLLCLTDVAQMTINPRFPGNGKMEIYLSEVDEDNSLFIEIDCLKQTATLQKFGKFNKE